MKFIIVLAVVLLSACTDKTGAADHLIGQGYTLKEYKGYNYNPLSCRKYYPFRTQFKVVDLQNETRTVTVCQSLYNTKYIFKN